MFVRARFAVLTHAASPAMSSKSSLAERRAEMQRKKQALAEKRARLAKMKQAAAQRREGPSSPDKAATLVDSILEGLASTAVPPAVAGAAGGASAVGLPSTAGSIAEKRALLTQVSGVAEVHVAGRTVESYSKSVQTETTEREAEAEDEASASASSEAEAAAAATAETAAAALAAAIATRDEEEAAASSSAPPLPPTLSAGAIRDAMSSDGFGSFLSSSSRVVERALGVAEQFGDIHVDYAGADSSEKAEEDVVSLVTTLFDERWSAQRAVTDVAWSPSHPELMLTSYFSRDGGRRGWDGAAAAAGADAEGAVLVWSVGMRKAPEYCFTAQSPVLAASFHRFSPHLVVGSGYSGQLFVWDMRSEKKSPVQRTPLCAAGHTHPVYSMAVVGSSHVHNITSVSTDGRLCVWDVAALHNPQEVVELKDVARSAGADQEIAVTCMAVQDGEEGKACVGSEDGSIYECEFRGREPGVKVKHVRSHGGPIMAMHYHPRAAAYGAGSSSSAGTGALLLSASVDWSVKLWQHAAVGMSGGAGSGGGGAASRSHTPCAPLRTFEHATDYIYDARWSPVHPSLFVTAEGGGNMELWNVNRKLSEPIHVHSTNVAGEGGKALTRTRWSNDGRRIAASDSAGTTRIYEVDSKVRRVSFVTHTPPPCVVVVGISFLIFTCSHLPPHSRRSLCRVMVSTGSTSWMS